MKHTLFFDFLNQLKTQNTQQLIESIEKAYVLCESYYEYDDDDEKPKVERNDSTHHYAEPLDIIVDNSKEPPEFDVYTDGGDHLFTSINIDDAIDFVKRTENKLRTKPTKSYGNRWLNHDDEYTINDLVYIMEKSNGRKPYGLMNVPEEEIQKAKQYIMQFDPTIN
jgi:hypothetical protein